MRKLSLIGIILGSAVIAAHSAVAELTPMDSIDTYRERYDLKDVFQKRVDDRGEGFEPLYGTRNFRRVLDGVMYRGGANNKHHRDHRRNNVNPLPDDGLQNLCEEGFDEAVYLYSTRFESAPESVDCHDFNGHRNHLDYRSISPFESHGAAELLRLIHRHLAAVGSGRPVYFHCWNGWHASGFISALALRQFCNFSAGEAVTYWRANTDGHDRGRESLLAKIRSFQPDPTLRISPSLRHRVCP